MLRSLNDYELTNIGILDANHRRAILNKISTSGGMDVDFNNLMGDLDSVISSLECFSVVCAVWSRGALKGCGEPILHLSVVCTPYLDLL